ncbi:uncharacterized protein LY79DRAFT_188654 [Colletotrichum navitas]|uniref:Uncharacterized protein n=1 Tax=Colletotrichum navitas TaxID=681940 RepID=A0AAD8V586_9PEZI|nr:uncharacterized protein LY79DRAFT_188654 [Colletotrichum navitas]KAK1593133.1 hypothetical protein LY79DRAFT_188654 [Colletotrichum navitas]
MASRFMVVYPTCQPTIAALMGTARPPACALTLPVRGFSTVSAPRLSVISQSLKGEGPSFAHSSPPLCSHRQQYRKPRPFDTGRPDHTYRERTRCRVSLASEPTLGFLTAVPISPLDLADVGEFGERSRPSDSRPLSETGVEGRQRFVTPLRSSSPHSSTHPPLLQVFEPCCRTGYPAITTLLTPRHLTIEKCRPDTPLFVCGRQ